MPLSNPENTHGPNAHAQSHDWLERSVSTLIRAAGRPPGPGWGTHNIKPHAKVSHYHRPPHPPITAQQHPAAAQRAPRGHARPLLCAALVCRAVGLCPKDRTQEHNETKDTHSSLLCSFSKNSHTNETNERSQRSHARLLCCCAWSRRRRRCSLAQRRVIVLGIRRRGWQHAVSRGVKRAFDPTLHTGHRRWFRTETPRQRGQGLARGDAGRGGASDASPESVAARAIRPKTFGTPTAEACVRAVRATDRWLHVFTGPFSRQREAYGGGCPAGNKSCGPRAAPARERRAVRLTRCEPSKAGAWRGATAAPVGFSRGLPVDPRPRTSRCRCCGSEAGH